MIGLALAAMFQQLAFSLPEIDAEAFQDPMGNGIWLELKGGPPHEVKALMVDLPRGLFRFDLHDNTRLDMMLDEFRAKLFYDWVQRHMKITVPETAMPDVYAKSTDTCPECFGTGYFKGFGAPCAKGCKP